VDIVLAGQGQPLSDCEQLLTRAGFDAGRDLAADDRCPVILGDVAHPFSQALQLIEAGRHLLVANPVAMSPSQLASLLAARKPRQAVFVWNERRHHPAYRLLANLIRSDETGWRPRYIRQTVVSAERPTAALLRWRAYEAIALVIELVGREPQQVSATGATSTWRGCLDMIAISMEFAGAQAFLHVGLGEGLEARETALAAHDRRAYVNELNSTTPVRLSDDGEDAAGGSRTVSCPSPSASELARRQCLAYLDAIANPARCQAEADLWLSTIGAWQATEASIAAAGTPAAVIEPMAAALRVHTGRGLQAASAPPPLKVVS